MPKPGMQRLSIDIPIELALLIDKAAADYGFSTRKEFVTFVLDEAIKQWAIRKGFIDEEEVEEE